MPVENISNTEFIKATDTLTTIELLLLNEDGTNYDLTDKTITARFLGAGKLLLEKQVSTDDNGYVVIQFDEGDYGYLGIGTVQAEIVVTDGTNTKIFPNDGYLEFGVVYNTKSLLKNNVNTISLQTFEQSFYDMEILAYRATERANAAAKVVEDLAPTIAELEGIADRAETAATNAEQSAQSLSGSVTDIANLENEYENALQSVYNNKQYNSLSDRFSSIDDVVSHYGFDVKAPKYGAIGDDASHKIGSIFSTKEEAIEKYPFLEEYIPTETVIAWQDYEVDFCAINQAIADASSSVYNGSGKVKIPKGNFVLHQIIMRNKVALEGESWKSVLEQMGNSNRNFVVLYQSGSMEWTRLSNVMINTNKNYQTQGNAIHYDGETTTATAYDRLHIIENVLIFTAKGDGLYTSAKCIETRATNVFVTGADGYGFNINGTDSFYVNCTSGAAGLSGWRCNGPNTRYSNCKGYGSGRLAVSGNLYGFLARTERQQFINCEAQDNASHGFVFLASAIDNAVNGCISDSNGTTDTSAAGFRFDNASYVIGKGNVVTDRYSPHRTAYGIYFNGACKFIQFSASVRNVTTSPIYGGFNESNTIFINGQEGSQTLTYASSVTPDPYAGKIMNITLTGNITINAPATSHRGMKLDFVIKQDEVGGRVVTFSGAYKTSWTPNTGANRINVISFVNTALGWVQINSQTGLI